MHKKGFTLAEILVALGIVGVIASLTLPVVVKNIQRQTNESRLEVSVMNLENALTSMLTHESVVDLTETESWQKKTFIDDLENYIQISILNNTTFQMKNGTRVEFPENLEEDMQITIDVNGNDGPNTENYDVFYYTVKTSGLLEKSKNK